MTEENDRETRLAAALRANLKRRKSQARGRGTGTRPDAGTADSVADPSPPEPRRDGDD